MVSELQSDLTWVQGIVQPYVKDVRAVLLGGSRGMQGGQLAVPGSDYDLLVLTNHVPQPVSLTLTTPAARKFDVILRDPGTLAWDVQEAKRSGRGTLLHLCAHSQVLFEQNRDGTELQTYAKQLHAAGPHAVMPHSLVHHLVKTADQVDALSQCTDANVRPLASAVLTHRAGVLALRAARKWTGKGKTLARFLAAEMPDVKHDLEDARAALATGNAQPFQHLLIDIIPTLYRGGLPEVHVREEIPFPKQPRDAADVFHYARQNATALQCYRESSQSNIRDSANNWLHYKYEISRSAVDPARRGRASGEYDYALMRYVGAVLDVNLVRQNRVPDHVPLISACRSLLRAAPDFTRAYQNAQQGHPKQMLAMGDHLVLQCAPAPTVSRPRISPQFCRLDAA